MQFAFDTCLELFLNLVCDLLDSIFGVFPKLIPPLQKVVQSALLVRVRCEFRSNSIEERMRLDLRLQIVSTSQQLHCKDVSPQKFEEQVELYPGLKEELQHCGVCQIVKGKGLRIDDNCVRFVDKLSQEGALAGASSPQNDSAPIRAVDERLKVAIIDEALSQELGIL